MIRIMLVDDENIIRMGLKKTIEAISDEYIVVGEASNGFEALEKISLVVPDVMIADIKMPEMDGLELARQVKHKYPDISVILLSGFAEFSFAQEALRLGVMDYILKPTKKEQIEEILNKVRKSIYGSDTTENSDCLFECKNDSIKVNEGKAKEYGLEIQGSRQCRKMVLMALDYINKNYNLDLSLKHMSEIFFTNQTYFSEVFKKDTGVAFSDYIAIIRIEKAKELLSSHFELKVYEVAEMVGFKDSKYFSQVFRKYTGYIPREFREQN